MTEAELGRALLHVVEDYRDTVSDQAIAQALEAEIERIRDTEANHGLEEFTR